MPALLNQYDQPVGAPMPEWGERPHPARITIEGTHCRLEPLLAERHAAELSAAYAHAPDGRDWTYMFAGPFPDAASYFEYVSRAQFSKDPVHYAVIDRRSGKALGTFALMRIDRINGVIEVGHVAFSPLLKRTAVATEAHYLLMRYAMDELGYRRYEWKCDSLNAPSRSAAARLGFSFEGIFRQAIVYKGRSRDTAWFSIIDTEWPQRRAAFEDWLKPENFDEHGNQRQALAARPLAN